MNKETKSALEGSIKKWEAIVDGSGIDEQATNCPLCLMFATGNDCHGCPVASETGLDDCNGSPYNDWSVHQLGDHNHEHQAVHDGCSTCLELAQAELDFLKRLL